MVPADELVIQGCPNVQEEKESQEGPAQPVDPFPGNPSAVEGLRDGSDPEQLGKITALDGHDKA